MQRKALLFIFLLVLITGLAFSFYAHYQPVASYGLEPRLDGNQYRKMYDYFAEKSHSYQVSFPFHARIFVPWLAAQLFPNNALQAFQNVNLIFSFLAVLSIFWLWSRLCIPLYLVIVGFLWLLFHWTGLIRLNLFDPLTVDLPLYFFQTLFLVFLLQRQWKHLLWLGPLATVQKESFPAFLLVLLLYGYAYNRYRKENHFPLLLIVTALGLSVLAKAMVNYCFPPQETGRSAVVTLMYHAREILRDPFLMIRWLVALFTAYGIILWLAVWQGWTSTLRRLFRQSGAPVELLTRKLIADDFFSPLLWLFSLMYFGLGLLAGGDFTRILFLGFPIVMTLILLSLRNYPSWLVWLACLLSLPLMRLEAAIPDIGKEPARFAEWYPEFAPVQRVLLWLAYLLVVGGLLGVAHSIHLKFRTKEGG